MFLTFVFPTNFNNCQAMPIILLSGEQIKIDFFNVIKGTNVVIEYLHDGVLLVVQTMSKENALIVASALSSDDAVTYSTAPHEPITFEFKLVESHVLITTNSFNTKIDGTHMEINYMFNSKIILSQRTSINTVKAIAEERQ